MKVILNKDLPNLGEEGDICDVSPGYARNYLLPRNLVLQYNRQNIALLEGRREAIEQRRQEKRKQAMSVKERLESEPMAITMPAGENGRLFGSVTSATISEALEKQGIELERKQIEIPGKTIKSVGTTKVRIRLYDAQEAELLVEVKPAGGRQKSSEKTEKKNEDRKPEPEAEQPESEDPHAYDEEDYEEPLGEDE